MLSVWLVIRRSWAWVSALLTIRPLHMLRVQMRFLFHGTYHLMPRPHLSREKVSGDNWVISWLRWVSGSDFKQALITCLHDVGPISLAYTHTWMTWHFFIGLSKIKTVDSAQPRNHSISHQTLLLVRRWGFRCRLWLSEQHRHTSHTPIPSL